MQLNDISYSQIEPICRKYYIRKLAVFGSTLNNTARPDSDLDLLVEFLPNHTPGFAFITIQDTLTELFHCAVDLHTSESLSRYFRRNVLQEAKTLYVQK
jgi:uncharacterized protein